jgi:hypothetical protein
MNVLQGGVGGSDDLQAITAFGRSLLDLAAVEHEHNTKEKYVEGAWAIPCAMFLENF